MPSFLWPPQLSQGRTLKGGSTGRVVRAERGLHAGSGRRDSTHRGRGTPGTYFRSARPSSANTHHGSKRNDKRQRLRQHAGPVTGKDACFAGWQGSVPRRAVGGQSARDGTPSVCPAQGHVDVPPRKTLGKSSPIGAGAQQDAQEPAAPWPGAELRARASQHVRGEGPRPRPKQPRCRPWNTRPSICRAWGVGVLPGRPPPQPLDLLGFMALMFSTGSSGAEIAVWPGSPQVPGRNTRDRCRFRTDRQTDSRSQMVTLSCL